MGSNGSKSGDRKAAFAERTRYRQDREADMKSLEAQQAAWKAQELLEKHYREQRLQEEESLKRNREAWLRKENLDERRRREKISHQHDDRTERLLQENERWEARRQTNPNAAAAAAAAATPNDRDEVTNKKKSGPRVKKTITNSKVRSQPHAVIEATASSSPESYRALYASVEFPFVEWTEIDYIREQHGVGRYVAENIIAMFDGDNAIPFIARYRKNTTLGMEVDQLRKIKESLRQARLLKQRADSFVAKMHKRSMCDSPLYALVHSTKSLRGFELIESMFDLENVDLEKAGQAGWLVPAARAIIRGQRCDPLASYAISQHSDDSKSQEQVERAVVSLVADIICKEPKNLEYLKILRKKHCASITTDKSMRAKENGGKTTRSKGRSEDRTTEYGGYYNFSALAKSLRPRQVLEIDRGERRKIIDVRVVLPHQFEKDFKEYCEREYADALETSNLHRDILRAAIDFAWKRTVESRICKLTRQEVTRRAENALVDDVARNAKRLLLVPPLLPANKTIMGIQAGFESGCVLAVVSPQGQVVRTEIIYPHDAGNPSAKQEAELVLGAIIDQHRCFTVALGDGPASRETRAFLDDFIEKPERRSLGIACTVLDIGPATFYASSRQSSIDFPFLEAKFKSAVSLARRLQDPMAELVKIEPRQWNMKIPWHNLPAKQLISQLNAAIEEAVSLVGVDVNTGSVSLLRRVAGLNEGRAKNLIKWRESSGPFRTRMDLKKVQGICDKTFEQCAAFLKIIPATAAPDDDDDDDAIPFNYLDQTCIHPEMYDVAEAFLRSIGCDNRFELGTPSFITKVRNSANLGYSALASKYYTNVETIKIIVEGLLMEKDLDVRGKMAEQQQQQVVFRERAKNLDDLVIGRVLVGVVRGKAHYGSFVDVGLEIKGLIHKSKTGGVTLEIGQKVETTVIKFDKERRRLGLALVKSC